MEFLSSLDQVEQNDERARLLKDTVIQHIRELIYFTLAQVDELNDGERKELNRFKRYMLEVGERCRRLTSRDQPDLASSICAKVHAYQVRDIRKETLQRLEEHVSNQHSHFIVGACLTIAETRG
jgi:hypothetical protein